MQACEAQQRNPPDAEKTLPKTGKERAENMEDNVETCSSWGNKGDYAPKKLPGRKLSANFPAPPSQRPKISADNSDRKCIWKRGPRREA